MPPVDYNPLRSSLASGLLGLAVAWVSLGTMTMASAVEPLVAPGRAAPTTQRAPEEERVAPRREELGRLWGAYKLRYLHGGRVLNSDENGFASSPAQGSALLRAVWSGDRPAFDQLWSWTRRHLQTRGDKLFARKYRGRVLDAETATAGDTDIALALVLASRRFADPLYLEEARQILADLWEIDVLHTGKHHYIIAGSAARREAWPPIPIAALAPFAYREFAAIDSDHPWRALVRTSYGILNWIYFDARVKLPPDLVYLDPASEHPSLHAFHGGPAATFGPAAFPVFWNLATDARWNQANESKLRRKMLEFFVDEWNQAGTFQERYSLSGEALSRYEGLALYPSIEALAEVENSSLAQSLRLQMIDPLWAQALRGRDTSDTLQSWLWLNRGLALKQVSVFSSPWGVPWAFPVSLDWLGLPVGILLSFGVGYRIFKSRAESRHWREREARVAAAELLENEAPYELDVYVGYGGIGLRFDFDPEAEAPAARTAAEAAESRA